jgi:hypothetical protein
MQAAICEVVEAVVRWRGVIFREEKEKAAAEAARESDPIRAAELTRAVKGMTMRPVPFVYSGENVLLQLPYLLEFLLDCPELVAHYGAGFSWRRNPFMRATTLDERAPTPRSAVRRYKIEDEWFEEVEPSLLELRQADELRLARMEEKLAQGGFWWPGVGAPVEHVRRVRAAEKVILAEEAAHGRRLHLSYASSKIRR